MLTSLAIDNFKGVSARQRIELAPVTLLFGANSAGKSTILHALAYVHELLVRGDADLDRTHLGGDVVELGGFRRLVHGHDASKTMRFRLEFRTGASLNRSDRNLEAVSFADLDDSVQTAWLELAVEHRSTTVHDGPLLAHAQVGFGDEPAPVAWLEVGPTLRDAEPMYVRINAAHPALVALDSSLPERWASVAVPEQVVRGAFRPDGSRPRAVVGYIGLAGDSPAGLPVFAVSRDWLSALPPLDAPIRVLMPGGDDPTPDDVAVLDEIRTFLEMTVQGTISQLVAHLERAAYLGPLRAVPPRGYLYERTGRGLGWADGLAAWDLLLGDRSSLTERTNARLRALDAHCQVAIQHLVAPAASGEAVGVAHVDATIRRLLLRSDSGALALPAEVGSGIAQVVPVVVACLAPRLPFVMIEQPELHVHPRLQTHLGDLFIEASASRQLLIETHSEHLILRLLRRIRETTDGELPSGAPAFTPDQLSVMHVESTPTGAVFKRLRVDPTGEFIDRWPSGFFAERMAELL